MKFTKPFYLTSEFWITVATILTALAGVFPVGGKISSIIAGAVAAAYSISRGLAKSGSVASLAPAPIPAPKSLPPYPPNPPQSGMAIGSGETPASMLGDSSTTQSIPTDEGDAGHP